jgi:hypothetical protein
MQLPLIVGKKRFGNNFDSFLNFLNAEYDFQPIEEYQ